MRSNMDVKQGLLKVLLKCFGSVLIVYLLFTPVVYVGNLLYGRWSGAEWLLIFAYLSQFLAVLCVGIYQRRKNQNIIMGDKKWTIFILLCICFVLSLVLHLEDIPYKWYMTWATTLRLYDIFADNLFFLVLIEQLFNKYLLTSFLICSLIVFCKPLKKRKGYIQVSR